MEKQLELCLNTLQALIAAQQTSDRAVVACVKAAGGKRTPELMEGLGAMFTVLYDVEFEITFMMGAPNVRFSGKQAETAKAFWGRNIRPHLPAIKAPSHIGAKKDPKAKALAALTAAGKAAKALGITIKAAEMAVLQGFAK